VWFIVFVLVDDFKVAVVVVVEDGGRVGNEVFGGKIVVLIVKVVMEVVLR